MCASRSILPPLFCKFLFAICLAAESATPAPAAIIDPRQIEVSLAPEKTSIMIGEPSYVLLNVKNKSPEDLRLIVAQTYQDDPGQGFFPLNEGRLLVRVRGKTGGDIARHPEYSGISFFLGPKKIPASGDYVIRIFLPNRVTFKQAGRYTVTVSTILTFETLRGKAHLPVELNTGIDVLPQDREKMGKLIDDTGSKMLKGGTQSDAMFELKAINDERVIPWFIKALRNYELIFPAIEELSKYNNDTAFGALQKCLETTAGDIQKQTGYSTEPEAVKIADAVRSSAARGLAKSPHPKAMPVLLALIHDPCDGVREAVVRVLMSDKLQPNEEIPLLKQMTHDENKWINANAKIRLESLAREGYQE